MTDVLHGEHCDGLFLLESATGRFLSLTRQCFSLFGTQILVVISILASWGCVCGENTDSVFAWEDLVIGGNRFQYLCVSKCPAAVVLP